MLSYKITEILIFLNIFVLFPIGVLLNVLTIAITCKNREHKNQDKETNYFLRFVLINNIVSLIAYELYYIQINFYNENGACFIMQFLSDCFMLTILIGLFMLYLNKYLQLRQVYISMFKNLKFYFIFAVIVTVFSSLLNSSSIAFAVLNKIQNDSLNSYLDCKVYSVQNLLTIDLIQIIIDTLLPATINFLLVCLISHKIISSKNSLRRSNTIKSDSKKEWRYVRNLQAFNFLNLFTLPVIVIRLFKHLHIKNSLSINSTNVDFTLVETIGHFLKSLRFLLPTLYNFMVNQLHRKKLATMLSIEK
jgi:hypothetical protein